MLNDFEMVNISPEIGTERALKTAKLYSLPEDTCVVFFHHFETITEKKKGGRTNTKTVRIDEEFGWYYVQDGKTHVGGYVPTMLKYSSINGSVVRLMWPDVSNTRLAHQRFLLLVARYKAMYKFSKLQKWRR